MRKQCAVPAMREVASGRRTVGSAAPWRSSASSTSPPTRPGQGRSERAFRTLQDRLPKELRLVGINDVEVANCWLREHYIGEYNKAFAIAPEHEGSAFVPDRAEAWREILCVIEERTVGNDNTIAWAGRRLQLPESRLRPHFVKARVHLHDTLTTA
jgi:hypothetical protein